MAKTILIVDSDDSVLQGLPESGKISFVRAASYGDALDLLGKDDDCRAVVAEIELDGEDGVVFLDRVRKQWPEVVCMAMSQKQDFPTIQKVLNSSRIYQFIAKPCAPTEFMESIGKALRKYDRDARQRNAAHNTLVGSVKAMVDILDLVNPEAMGFSKRIRERVLKAGKALGVKSLWQLELAVLLSHVGCVALPGDLMEKMDRAEPLTPEEKQTFGMHPSIAANLLSNIDQMKPVAEIVRQQHARLYEGQPLEARIIKVALELDFQERKGKNPMTALTKMAGRKNAFDARVVKVMHKLLRQSGAQSVRKVSVEELQTDMVLAEDLVNMEGVKLMLRGQKVSKASLLRLQSFHIALGVVDPICVVSEE